MQNIQRWIDLEFDKIIKKFIDDFFKLNKIKISYTDATRLIAEKIKLAGGINV
jgi:hypothetical protein